MAEPTGRSDESVLLRLQATGRPAPRLRLAGSDDGAEASGSTPLRTTSRYEIVGEIAKGGVGVVMRGRDADLGRDVALKVLREEHLDSVDLLRRFVEEAQVGGQLQHPGIVPVYELGLQPDGRPFFAMKLVKGGTLAAALSARKNPDDDRRRFLAVFEQTCQTMAYVHSRGVVHRDLKPSNVMIGAFGEVQVVDWGFGKVLAQGGVADERRAKREMKGGTVVATVRSGSSGSESIAGSVMGTPAYMPPEQALGQVDRVDERSDVFSLGAILCEILTGRPPYTGEDLLGQARQCKQKDAHARLHACGADDGLVRLAIECLAPLPKDRPKSADALVTAVNTYLSDADERAHRSQLHAVEAKAKADKARAAADDSRTEAGERVRARRQTWIIAAAVLVVLAASGFAWSAIASRRDARDRIAVAAVDDAIQDATRLAAAKDFAKALAATERARDLATAEGVDATVAARPDALAAEIRAAESAARDEAGRQAKDAVLLARLDAVRELTRECGDAGRSDAEFAAAFRDYGVDADALDAAATAARLAARGDDFALQAAAALDEWACLRRTDPRLTASAPAPASLAGTLDHDTAREQIRSSAASGEVVRLRGLATGEAADSLPAQSVVLLAHALVCANENDAATALLRRAFRRYPSEFWIEYGLACRLVCVGPSGAKLALRYATAARALRPDSLPALRVLARAQTLSGRADAAVVLLSEACARAPADVRLRASLADALCAKGEFAAAIAAAREALRLDGSEPSRHVGVAEALLASGDLDAALAEARLAGRSDSRGAACLGEVLLARGDVAESIAAWTEATRLDARDAAAQAGLGRALAAKGDADGARRKLKDAVALDPADSVAQTALACVLREGFEHFRDAQSACEAAVRCAAGGTALRVVPWVESGDTSFSLGELDAAQNAHEEALVLLPGDARARAGLGMVLQARGEHERAIAEFRAAIAAVVEARRRRAPVVTYTSAFALVPLEPRFRAALGVSLRATGKLDEALEEFRRAVEARPDEWSLQHELGVTLLATGAARDALTPLRAAVRLQPEATRAQDDLGRAALAAGQVEEALAAFRAAVESDFSAPSPHRHLGETLLDRTGDFVHAKEEIEQALRDAPDDPSLRLSFARALLAVGDADAALVELRAALHLAPDDPETMLALTRRLAAVGADDEALAVLRETARGNPASSRIRACHGLALMSRGRVADAVAELRAARDCGAAEKCSPSDAADAAAWLARAERLAALEPRLGDAVRNPDGVAGADDRIAFAQLAWARGSFDAAARLHRAAFAASPRLADDLAAGHRYAAARAAAHASAVVSKQTTAAVAAAWRRQALEWLRADLAARGAQVSGGTPAVAAEARATLATWRRDEHLAAVRADAELAKLAAGERDEWRALWCDVDAALAPTPGK